MSLYLALGSDHQDPPSHPTLAPKGLWALGIQELNCLQALEEEGQILLESFSYSTTSVPLISLSKECCCLGQTALD